MWYKSWKLWAVVILVVVVIGYQDGPEPTQADTSEYTEADSPNDQYDDPGKPCYNPTLDPGYEELEAECKEAWDTPQVIGGGAGSVTQGGHHNSIEVHIHKPQRKRRKRRVQQPVLIHPIMRHEMIIVPSDGSKPVVFMDNAPPRVVVVDKQLARAYASHMLGIAQTYGTR